MNVLTIDFDIIMAPSIELYNELIGDRRSIEQVVKQYPQLTSCTNADLYIYEYLTEGLMSLMKRGKIKRTISIKNHNDIVPFVTKGTNLCNIDHHHDLGYGYEQNVSRRIFRAESGNWVKYLMDKELVTKYCWVHDDNSVNPTKDSEKKYIKEKYPLSSFDLREVDLDIDLLVLCSSPQWIPVNILPLYFIWENICKT